VVDRLKDFIKLLNSLIEIKEEPVSEIIKEIVELTGYAENLAEERIQNIAELMASGEGVKLNEFLDRVSLFTKLDDTVESDKVSLMTFHTAKGLEFSVVFITGLEEGLLPYFKAFDNEEELEEERRLFYVGMTRAKNHLYLTGAKKRRVFSKLQDQEPSRFLFSIPKECCRWVEKAICKHYQPTQAQPKPAAKKPATPTFKVPYKTGCRVRHPKWGVGVVRDCYGEGDDIKVCVNFPGVGIKRLALKFAHLEKV